MAEGRKDGYKTLYHYTSKENAAAIKQQGVIQPSATGVYGGDKVYLTSMKPSAGKAAIACNNYDGVNCNYGMSREARGDVDAHIPVRLPKSQVTKVADPMGRDIYTHDGPVKLPGSKK